MTLDLDALEKIARDATTGEWYATTRPDAIAHICDRNGGRLFDTTHHGKMREDAQHIAAFNPKVALELIAEIRELHQKIRIFQNLANIKRKDDT